jgi:signal transduction histidine kinase
VKVATRITMATAVVVAIASATYALFDLRARVAERQMAVEREARAVASTIRVSLENQAMIEARDARYKADQLQREIEAIEKKLEALDTKKLGDPPDRTGAPPVPATPEQEALRKQQQDLQTRLTAARGAAGLARPIDQALAYRAPGDAQLRELSRASGGWRVTVIARSRATEPAGGDATAAQLRRLGTLLDVPQLTFADIEEDHYFFGVPLRIVSGRDEERAVLAMLELATPADTISTTSGDLGRAAILVLLIVAVSTIVVGALASRFVSQPITKLLRGIDDVAKGDLSHVILSERDDEIGAIATRFNDMTYSLRESRAETQRQNEDKLALEQRLGQTEKLATIGQLAAEIAHEVGTPLNVIAGRARSIQRKCKDPEAVEKNAGIVAEQTARITRIIQRLLDFTRRKVGTTERAAVDLNALSMTTIELLAGQFSHAKVKTRVDRAATLPRVAGDTDRLQQVLINLLLNAVQAMPEGGSVVVDTGVVRRTRPGLETNADQEFVRWSVSDTGVGIPADIKDKIFDPFYTTKEGQGGTGLGLAVCSGIVKEHDGWIEVDEASGGGTVFRVYLPA